MDVTPEPLAAVLRVLGDRIRALEDEVAGERYRCEQQGFELSRLRIDVETEKRERERASNDYARWRDRAAKAERTVADLRSLLHESRPTLRAVREILER